MSALEQASLESAERRRAPRLRIQGTVAALIGRGDGVLLDLSARGVKIRHASMVRRGATVRVSFAWNGERFGATAEVLASRVASLAGAATTYDTRLRFTSFDSGAADVLARALDSLAGRDVRRWVANLRGWSDEIREMIVPSLVTGSFVRCRLRGARWEAKYTRDLAQPEDGFLLPISVDDDEVVRLCEDYVNADDDGRRVIRLMAAAAVEQATLVRKSI